MNPILPLAALGIGVGIFAYEKTKKSPVQKLEAAQKSQSYVNANWETHLSVHDVQHELNALGAKPTLEEDGVLGPKTLAAIKSFQSQAGLSVDGIVGPETTAALEHASGGGAKAAGWFLMCDPDDDCDDCDEYAIGASAIEAVDRSRPGRGIRQSIEGDHGVKVGAAGWGSNDWCAPSVAQILADPQQRMQIGLNKMRHDQAVEAFGGAPAAGWDYSFLPDQGTSEEQEYGTIFNDLEAERQANLNAVGAGGCEWSAPDEEEALEDPVQRAEMGMYDPYEDEESWLQGDYATEEAEEMAEHAPEIGLTHEGYGGPPYLPFAESNEGFYGPHMRAGEYMHQGGGFEGANAQGYEFASQPGRKF